MTTDVAAGTIHRASTELAPFAPLHVHLVAGADYAVWIDSGTKQTAPLLARTMEEAGVPPERLRFVLNTHSHHDHIGGNATLKEHTGALVAAPGLYAHWHLDFERHYQEFARPFPELVPDTPELRDEVLGILDGEHAVDLRLAEGATFDLGGGVALEAFAFPGHMKAELGFLELSTRTLVLGDAITGLDWPIFHSHLDVAGYRASLDRIEALVRERDVARVLFAHFPPAGADETIVLAGRARAYLDEIEATLLRVASASDEVTLGDLWTGVCERMSRRREFRALNTVAAHVDDLLARRVLHEREPGRYGL